LPRKRQHGGDERIRELEQKVLELQQRIRVLEAEKQSFERNGRLLPEASTNSNELDKSLPFGESKEQSSIEPPEVRSAAAVEELAGLLWTLQLGEHGETSFQGPSGNLCFPHKQPVLPEDKGSGSDTAAQLELTNLDVSSIVELFMTRVSRHHFSWRLLIPRT
jgi:hypothetical protein